MSASNRRRAHARTPFVNRLLIRSTPFVRAAKRLLKRSPDAAADLLATLALLSVDPLHQKLKTHKLKGTLEGSLACSVGYDLRIIFEFVQHEGVEAILLQTVGTHDEVY